MLKEEDAELLLEILKEADYSKSFAVSDSLLSLLFYQSRGVDSAQLEGSYYGDLLERRILIRENGVVYASVRVVFFRGNYFIVDSPYMASSGGVNHFHSNKKGMYGYIGNDGLMLLNHMIVEIADEKYQNGLDIGTGSGLIGISLLPWINSIMGVDITEPAINWAKLNTRINHVEKYFPCVGNLYEPAQGKGPFDFIVSNPSYSFYPPEFVAKYQIRAYELSEDYGLEVVFKIIDGFKEHLTPNGRAFICTSVPIVCGQEFLIDKIKEKYSRYKYSFKVHYNFSQTTPTEFKKFYRSCGIDRLDFVFISIRNGQEFSIKKTHSKFYLASRFRLPLKIPSKLKSWIMKNLA